jgi:hypothetical protein
MARTMGMRTSAVRTRVPVMNEENSRREFKSERVGTEVASDEWRVARKTKDKIPWERNGLKTRHFAGKRWHER